MFEITDEDERQAMTMAKAMRVAIDQRQSVYRNRSLKDFVRACHELGIQDDDTLGSIEIGISQYATGYVHAEKDEYGAWEVREVSR